MTAAPRDPTLTVVVAATTVALVAFTTVVTTVGVSADEFGAGAASRTWALSGMSLGLAGALLTTGALADRLGRARVFRWSCWLLALTTAVAALAPAMLVLVLGRVLQGVAGAGVLAAGLGMLGDAFPAGAARTRATSLWGAALGGGIALGPVVAAAATELWSWRVGYWAGVLAAVAVAVAARSLPARDDVVATRRLDLPGAVTMAVAMLALTAGITAGRTSWTDPLTVGLLVVGVVALAVFPAVERRSADPMLDLGLLRSPGFVASLAGAVTTGLTMIAVMSFLPTVLTEGSGLSTLAAGAILATWSATSTVVATQVRRLPETLTADRRLVVGVVLCGIGAAGLAVLGPGVSWAVLLPGLAVAGVGSGVVNAALARLAVASVPPQAASVGSGANNTLRYLGAALGIAIVVAVVATGGPGADGLYTGFNRAALVAAGLSAIAAVAIGALSRRLRSYSYVVI